MFEGGSSVNNKMMVCSELLVAKEKKLPTKKFSLCFFDQIGLSCKCVILLILEKSVIGFRTLFCFVYFDHFLKTNLTASKLVLHSVRRLKWSRTVKETPPNGFAK